MHNLIFYNMLLAIVFASAANAGAWTQKKGGYFLKIAGGRLSTGQEYDANGNLQRIAQEFDAVLQKSTYSEWVFQGYFEYGLTRSLTLIANFPYKIAGADRTELSDFFPGGTRDTTFSTSGFGDLWASARLNVLRLPVVASLQGGVKLPLGYAKPGEIPGPALGNGETEYQISLLIGQGFHPLPLYVSGEIGYRVRNGALNDEILFGVEMGYTYNNALLKLALTGVSNTRKPQVALEQTSPLPLTGGENMASARLFGDHDLLKLNAGFIYPLSDALSLDGGVFHVISGKNIIASTMFQLGVVLSR